MHIPAVLVNYMEEMRKSPGPAIISITILLIFIAIALSGLFS